jgi:hypothetical protein
VNPIVHAISTSIMLMSVFLYEIFVLIRRSFQKLIFSSKSFVFFTNSTTTNSSEISSPFIFIRSLKSFLNVWWSYYNPTLTSFLIHWANRWSESFTIYCQQHEYILNFLRMCLKYVLLIKEPCWLNLFFIRQTPCKIDTLLSDWKTNL